VNDVSAQTQAANVAASNGIFLRASGVSKRFEAKQALQGVDFELGADELLVILGPTGAGKTTLLRTIAGLETPDRGEISMGGRDVTHVEPAKRDVALVFQNFSLYPRWTVRQNLEFPLRAPGRTVPEAEIKERIEWAAELLKVTRYLERDAARLSGGEMQRVAIGRAIVRRPKLFLMDEPLTNLDAKLREVLRVELLELRRKLGIPMLFVTHDQAEALSMADRILVLSQGQVLQTGTPREIYERPCSKTVALQVGQPAINLVPVSEREGFFTSKSGTRLVRSEEITPERRMPASGDSGSASSGPTLAFRPEHVLPEGGDSEATVKVVEYMGATTTVLADWADSHVHFVTRGRVTIKPGDKLFPRIDATKALLF
jgi:multiple sugar transport system ATP-binding protein